VVITGGAGFVGSHLCRRFLLDGHEVICVDNLSTGDLANVEELLANERFRLMRADVTDYLDVPGPARRRPALRLPRRAFSTRSGSTCAPMTGGPFRPSSAGLERTIRWFAEQLQPPVGTLPGPPWARPSRVGGTGPVGR
jgi:NAD(P)-dependent dehydrogenase (short-subunit alcohol dehydrogenase family)